jgi:hypothetical protein
MSAVKMTELLQRRTADARRQVEHLEAMMVA